mmetsp:Transcript_18667/g.23839  ORF Transcript_18667/g.23839 Transcript_18667/m.23839 type:complete len:82 (-) Transcript_18667:217-462(-)
MCVVSVVTSSSSEQVQRQATNRYTATKRNKINSLLVYPKILKSTDSQPPDSHHEDNDPPPPNQQSSPLYSPHTHHPPFQPS